MNENKIFKKGLEIKKDEMILIKQMIENGMTYGEIIKETGRSKSSIVKIIKKYGLKYNCKKNERPIVQLSLNFQYIQRFESISMACRKIGNVSGISQCARGITKTYKGYKWMYEEDYKKMIEE